MGLAIPSRFCNNSFLNTCSYIVFNFMLILYFAYFLATLSVFFDIRFIF